MHQSSLSLSFGFVFNFLKPPGSLPVSQASCRLGLWANHISERHELNICFKISRPITVELEAEVWFLFLVLKPPGWKHSIPCQCNFALCRLCLLGTLCAASVFPSAQVDTWMVRSLFSTSAYWLPLMLRLSGMFFIFFCSLDYQIVVLCISHFFQRLFLIPKIYWSVFLILLPAFGRCCLAAHDNPLQLLLLCWILAAAIVFGGIGNFCCCCCW